MEWAFRILKPSILILCAALLAGLTACSDLQNSAALQPDRYAPPTREDSWDFSATPLPLGRIADTNASTVLSESNLPPLLNAVTNAPEKTNDLVDLIAIAQQANPQTRAAWERARAAAARLGLADSAYAPVLALLASGGYSHNDYPSTSTGNLVSSGGNFSPGLTLEWTLLDFGRRRATFDTAAQQLLEANFQFNRTHQQVAYDVERTFYAFDSSRARLEAAKATLRTAETVEEVASKRLDNGLTTQTELLETRQELARAKFDLQSAERDVSDAWAALAENLGISPTVTFKVVELSSLPVPTNLVESVEFTIDRALRQRPDLAAQLAQLRAREADVRRARAEYRPSLALSAQGGGTMGNWRSTLPGSDPSSYNYIDPQYSAGLTLSWNLFDGFSRESSVREAEARRAEAEAALSALELRTLREVWKAYADAKASFLEYDFAESLLTASQDSYEATLTSYKNGLGTIVELLTAERNLARARTTLVESRAEVLNAAAALAFAAGDKAVGPARTAHATTGASQ
jgi:outer membrane protein TolC